MNAYLAPYYNPYFAAISGYGSTLVPYYPMQSSIYGSYIGSYISPYSSLQLVSYNPYISGYLPGYIPGAFGQF